MSEFSKIEKDALSILCWAMIVADGKIDTKELLLWSEIKELLEIEDSGIPKISGESLLKAMLVVRDMSFPNKVLVFKFLSDIMKVDGSLDIAELKLINMVVDACGLKNELNVK